MSDVYDDIVNERGPDITLASDSGINVTVDDGQGDGPVIRIDALPGPGEQTRTRRAVRITGDDCVSVYAIPHVMVDEDGSVVKAADCGMVVVGSTCKPCCQCEDYYAAATRLHAVQTRLAAVRKKLAAAGDTYDDCRTTHRDTVQMAYFTRINSIDNVRISCSRMGGRSTVLADGKLRTSCTAAMSIMNPTPSTVTVSSISIKPVAGSATVVETAWSATNGRTGGGKSSGTSMPTTSVFLSPGGTLSVSMFLDIEGALIPSFSASASVANAYGKKTLNGGA